MFSTGLFPYDAPDMATLRLLSIPEALLPSETSVLRGRYDADQAMSPSFTTKRGFLYHNVLLPTLAWPLYLLLTSVAHHALQSHAPAASPAVGRSSLLCSGLLWSS